MSQLRDKDTGCEWDKEQTYESIAPYTIEEAYEVVDAIERSNIKISKRVWRLTPSSCLLVPNCKRKRRVSI